MRLEEATALVRAFHTGSPDLSRVTNGCSTDEQKVTALLRDLLQHSDLSVSDLMAAGCPARVLEALDALTRRSDESYDQFLRRAAADPLARAVLLTCLNDASDPDGRARAIIAATRATQPPASHYAIGELEPASDGPFTRYDCGACGRPAGRVKFHRGASGASVVVTSLLGRLWARVEAPRAATVEAAVVAGDAATLQRFEFTPFWCPHCEQSYCRRHWTTEVVMDDGLYDCTYGMCPQGHRTMIDD